MARKPPPTDDDPDDSIPRIGLAARKKPSDEIPKIPRGRLGFAMPPTKQLIVIGMTIVTLIVVITMSRRCGDGVGKVFKSMEVPDGGPIIYLPAPPLAPEDIPPSNPVSPAPDPAIPPSAAPPGQPYETPVPPNSPADPGGTKPRLRPVPATPSR